MKTIIPPVALLVSALALVPLNLRANGTNDTNSVSWGTNHCDEHLVAKIILKPTTDAPAGASGVAKLETENEDGMQQSTLALKLRGLSPGDYLLSILMQSDGSTNVLGQFTVHSQQDCEEEDDEGQRSGHGDGEDDDEDDDDQGDDNNDQGQNHDGDHHSTNVVTEIEISLPSDLNPLDIGQITVSQTDGTAILVGDLTNPSPGTTLKFRGLVQLTAGAGAPTAYGKATMRTSIRKGKRQTRFTLVASQVPPSAIFQVHVNGQQVATVKSSRRGRVVVSKLPRQQAHIRSVHLMDAQGKSAVHSDF